MSGAIGALLGIRVGEYIEGPSKGWVEKPLLVIRRDLVGNKDVDREASSDFIFFALDTDAPLKCGARGGCSCRGNMREGN